MAVAERQSEAWLGPIRRRWPRSPGRRARPGGEQSRTKRFLGGEVISISRRPLAMRCWWAWPGKTARACRPPRGKPRPTRRWRFSERPSTWATATPGSEPSRASTRSAGGRISRNRSRSWRRNLQPSRRRSYEARSGLSRCVLVPKVRVGLPRPTLRVDRPPNDAGRGASKTACPRKNVGTYSSRSRRSSSGGETRDRADRRRRRGLESTLELFNTHFCVIMHFDLKTMDGPRPRRDASGPHRGPIAALSRGRSAMSARRNRANHRRPSPRSA
jgi:hypothetical protein